MAKIVIVDSVKGGCGKTTMAIATAISESNILKVDDWEKSKVCVIDMDLLGTSMERMLFNRELVRNPVDDLQYYGIIKCAKHYLNDLADGSAQFNDEYRSTVKIKLYEGTCFVDFIVSSPLDKDRRKFKASGNSNYAMQITQTHFRGIIRKLTERLITDGFETLVFDMPPNSDSYTDVVFDLFLDDDYRKSKADIIKSVELRIISTYDKSHIYANSEWLKNMIEGPDHHWRQFDEIKFILNNNNIGEDKAVAVRDSIKKYIQDHLPESNSAKCVNFFYKEYNDALALHFLFNGESDCDELNRLIPFSDFSKSELMGWYKIRPIPDKLNQ